MVTPAKRKIQQVGTKVPDLGITGSRVLSSVGDILSGFPRLCPCANERSPVYKGNGGKVTPEVRNKVYCTLVKHSVIRALPYASLRMPPQFLDWNAA